MGWGTPIFTPNSKRLIFVGLYSFIEFARRLADPVLMYKFSKVVCEFNNDENYDDREREADEINFLMHARDDLAYLDFGMCIVYWLACLHWTVQTFKSLKTDPDWNQTYLGFLGVMVTLAGTDVAAYLMEVLFMDAGLVSYKNFLILLEIIEFAQLGMIGVIMWLFRPKPNGGEASNYAHIPAADDPQFNYLELSEGGVGPTGAVSAPPIQIAQPKASQRTGNVMLSSAVAEGGELAEKLVSNV